MRSRVGLVLAVALFVLLGFDFALSQVDARLDPPDEWWDPAATRQLQEMDRVASTGTTSDLVLAGSSMTLDNLQVDVLEAELDSVTNAHNVGLAGARATDVGRWLVGEVAPRLGPTRVVWGISSLDFNSNRVGRSTEGYDAARGTRGGVFGALDRLLGEVSTLSRHRQGLRGLGGWSDILVGEGPDVDADDSMRPDNTHTGRLVAGSDPGLVRDQMLVDFDIGPRQADVFAADLVRLQSQGVEVVLLLHPVPGSYVAAHPAGRADFDRFVRFIERVAAELDIPVIDYSDRFGSTSFADHLHLNATGAERFSALLASDLRDLGW